MENDVSIVEVVVPAVAVVVGIAIKWGWDKLRGYVKKTPAQWDDELVKAVEGAVGSKPDPAAKQ